MIFALQIELNDATCCNGCPLLRNTIGAHLCAADAERKEFGAHRRHDGERVPRPDWCPLRQKGEQA